MPKEHQRVKMRPGQVANSGSFFCPECSAFSQDPGYMAWLKWQNLNLDLDLDLDLRLRYIHTTITTEKAVQYI